MSSEEDQIIVSGRHQTGVLKKMKFLREKSALCDVTLQVGDAKLAAHKVVLAASSQFFEFMLTTENIKESKMDCIEIKEVCPTAFSALLDFMYTGHLLVKEENIMKLLEVADRLKIADAKMECLSYLQKHIKISNCILIRNIAEKHFFTELEKKVNSFICFNFVDVIKTDGFFNLSLNEVKKFITEESFRADSVLCKQAISSWIEHDKASREELHEELSKTARIHYESLSERGMGVRNFHQQKKVFFSTKASSSTEAVFLDLSNLSRRSVTCRPNFQSVCSILHKNSICLIGEKSNECAIYDLEKEDWTLNKMPFNNSYSAGCSIHDQIYLISSNDSRATFSYDVEKNTLQVQPCLRHKRTYPGVAFDGWCIYVCGGETATAERRDLRTNEWRSISDLPIRMGTTSATSLNQHLYCASLNGNFYQYDSRNGVWMEKAVIPRSYNGLNQQEWCYTNTTASAQKESVILGSTDQFAYAYNGQALHKYDPIQNVWESIVTIPGYTDFVCVYPEF